MTDPILELELQLRQAAAERAERRPSWRRRFRAPVNLGMAASAAAVAVILAVAISSVGGIDEVAVDEPRSGNPRATVSLKSVAPAPECPGSAPRALAAELRGFAVFSRPQRADDAVTVDPSRLPVATLDLSETRVTAGASGIWLVPTAGVRADATCEADETDSDGHGICMLAQGQDDPRISCHTVAQIRAGKAAAILEEDAEASHVVGIVPDGVRSVTVAVRDVKVEAKVAENAWQAQLESVAAGDHLVVHLDLAGDARQARSADCTSPAPPLRVSEGALPKGVLEELPALRSIAGPTPPQALVRRMRELRSDRVWLDSARRVIDREGTAFWAGVLERPRRCNRGDLVAEEYGRPWLACLIAIAQADIIAEYCNGPERNLQGMSTVAVGGQTMVMGIAEPDVSEVMLEVRGRERPIRVPSRGGFFAGRLPRGIAPEDVAPPR